MKVKFRCIKMDRWKAQHPKKDPVKCGLLVHKVPKMGLRVLVRKLPKGEFDLEIEDSFFATIRESIDDGACTLKKGQQAAKFRDKARKATQIAKPKGSNQSIVDMAQLDDLLKSETESENSRDTNNGNN